MSRLAGPKALVNDRDCEGLPWRPTWGQLLPPQTITIVWKCEPRNARINFSREIGLWYMICTFYMLASNSVCFILKAECKTDQVKHICRLDKIPWLQVCSKLSGSRRENFKESDKWGINFYFDLTNKLPNSAVKTIWTWLP